MEEVLLGHDDIVEAAVVSKNDELKGEIPIGFVVAKAGRNLDPKKKKNRKRMHCLDQKRHWSRCFLLSLHFS